MAARCRGAGSPDILRATPTQGHKFPLTTQEP